MQLKKAVPWALQIPIRKYNTSSNKSRQSCKNIARKGRAVAEPRAKLTTLLTDRSGSA